MNKMLSYLKGYKRGCACSPFQDAGSYVRPVRAAGDGRHREHRHCRPRFPLYPCVCGSFRRWLSILSASLLTASIRQCWAVGYSTALRHALFAHIQTLSFTEMDTLGTSTLITRMTSDMNQVQNGLNLFLRSVPAQPVRGHRCHGHGLYGQRPGRADLVVTIPLLSVVVFSIMAATRPLYKTVQNRLDRVLGLTRENLTGVRVVRALIRKPARWSALRTPTTC